jgi:PAS domain S-box-containing protein
MFMLSDYQNFFNTLELLLFVLDTDGNIIYCNDTACTRLGYTREELIGTPVVNIHPPDQRMFAEILIKEMLAGQIDSCPIPIIQKNGKLIQVETKVVVGTWQGKPALYGVTKDVTALKLSNEKFTSIFRFCPIPLAITNVVDGKIYDVNDAWCEYTGYSLEDIEGKTMYDLKLYQNEQDRESLISKLEHSGVLQDYDIVMQVKNDKIVMGKFSAVNIQIDGKDCWITAMVDRTNQEKLEQAITRFMNTMKKHY